MAKHRYPRSHDHQHTSRKCPLTPTRPGTGGSVPPGSPLAPSLGTAVTPEPHPPTPKFGGPACMRPGARGPFAVRPVSGRPAAPGPPARPPNLWCWRVWFRGHGSASGGGPGEHGRAPGSGRAGVRGNLRDECWCAGDHTPPVLVQSILLKEHVCVGGCSPDLYALPTDNPSRVHE